MNRNRMGPLRSMIIAFIVLNGFFVAGKGMLAKWNIDQAVVIGGNLLLFLVSLVSFVITRRSLSSPNPNAFVRAMYGSFMIKLFVCAIAAFAYIMTVKEQVNKPALFTCMGLYILYAVFEVAALTKMLKQKKNA